MSKEEPETFESTMDYLENKEVGFIDKLGALLNDMDGKLVFSVFDPKQARVLKAIVKTFQEAIDFHTNEDTEPHAETLKDEINRVDAKLRNHRHETGKTFSAKAEF